MLKTIPLHWLLPAVLATAGLMASCGQQQPPSAADVVVTVNGTPITAADVRYVSSRAGSHQEGGTSPEPQQVLETIILQELAYQRAMKLGMDSDPEYQSKLGLVEVQVNEFKRKNLSEIFLRKEIARQAAVDETEARQYFEANAKRISTEINAWQILRRSEAAIKQVQSELEQGIPFEEVAGKHFPGVPGMDRKPWELGYLRWKQLPSEWRNVVYDLKIGETSGIIAGRNNRFWIIKVIDTREIPDVAYEDIKPMIMDVLISEKSQKLRETIDRDLRDKARIVYSDQPITPAE